MTDDEEAEKFHRELEADTLARTIWGEARGEGVAGMQAVACVVMNRLKTAKEKRNCWWGRSVIEICHKPFQFSCWNKGDPNYKKLLAADEADKRFLLARQIAERALSGDIGDQTGGATHYHASGISPHWTKFEKPSAVIGRHVFYRPVE